MMDPEMMKYASEMMKKMSPEQVWKFSVLGVKGLCLVC